jgi:hypothetical protein
MQNNFSVEEFFADGSRSDKKTQSSTVASRISAVCSVITALAAFLSYFSHMREHFVFAWIFLFVVIIGVAANLYRPAKSWLRKNYLRLRRNRIAIKCWPTLQAFERRLADFINCDRIDNIQSILKDICGHNLNIISNLCYQDYLPPLFSLVYERHKNLQMRKESDFRFAIRELYELISSYNSNYVLTPLEKLRSPEWKERVGVEQKRIIEDFRERWVRFLEDYQHSAQDLNHEFGESIFGCYFNRPKQL